jgi:predicted kinase
MKQPEIIILVGIPLSGKSSYRKKFENTHEIICRDDIRAEWWRKFLLHL